MKNMIIAMLGLMAFAPPFTATAQDGKHHAHKKLTVSSRDAAEATPFGQKGDAKKATRTIHVELSDRMRFTPDSLRVRQGDTVKFVLKNSGKTMHEFVLGTLADLKDHAEMMKKHPGMEHDEPHMMHVSAGKTRTLAWRFNRAGVFHFGCLLPGHFEAGMVGKINVSEREKS